MPTDKYRDINPEIYFKSSQQPDWLVNRNYLIKAPIESFIKYVIKNLYISLRWNISILPSKYFDELNTYLSDNGLIVVKTRWKNPDKPQDFSFKWTDQKKGINCRINSSKEWEKHSAPFFELKDLIVNQRMNKRAIRSKQYAERSHQLNKSKYFSNLFKSSMKKFDRDPVIPTVPAEERRRAFLYARLVGRALFSLEATFG